MVVLKSSDYMKLWDQVLWLRRGSCLTIEVINRYYLMAGNESLPNSTAGCIFGVGEVALR